jgi:hypothetical protein
LKCNEKQQLHSKLWLGDLVGSDNNGDLGIIVKIITNILHGVEPFQKRHQSLSYSRISQYFMELQRFITVFTRALYWSLS